MRSQLLLGLVALLQGSHSYAWSSFRNVECLNLLLSSGADLRRRDKFGRQVHVQGAQGWPWREEEELVTVYPFSTHLGLLYLSLSLSLIL